MRLEPGVPVPVGQYDVAGHSLVIERGTKHNKYGDDLDRIICVDGRRISFEEYLTALERDTWPPMLVDEVRACLHHNEDVAVAPREFGKMGSGMLRLVEAELQRAGLAAALKMVESTKQSGFKPSHLIGAMSPPYYCHQCGSENSLKLSLGQFWCVGCYDAEFADASRPSPAQP